MADNAPWLIMGLGNPGPQYETTRHNVGHMVVDELCDRTGVCLSSHKGVALMATARIGPIGPGAARVVLAKSTGYMNTSGGPTKNLAAYFNVPSAQVVAVHDELDLDSGVVRVKFGGGEGGHNGLRDISRAIATKDYPRIRVGIGRPPGRQNPADYVLKPFSRAECAELPFTLSEAADAVELLVRQGLTTAQNTVNSQ